VRHLAVIGAGWAGLAAAVQAVQDGHRVTLYDMAPALGGRARRADTDAHGLALDNGQHILIGAYSECLRLMQTVGVDIERALLRVPLALRFADGRGLALPRGAAPIAFARGVLGARHWPLSARLSLLMHAARWQWASFTCPPQTTVAELTASLPAVARDEVFEPLSVAALNTPSRDASAQVLLRVLRDALFRAPGGADLLLPRVDLSELWPQPAARWLGSHGADVRLGSRVLAIDRRAGAVPAWNVDGAACDAIVLAASAVESARLAQPHAPAWSARAAALRYEPIVTVLARSEGARLPQPMLALVSDGHTRPAQFVFDLGQLRQVPAAQGVLALVVSGAARWVERGLPATTDAALAQARDELAAVLPGPLTPLSTLCEKRATFACTPAVDRPPAAIAPGLWAAGDYVEGPYPATLEGAARAGVRAARSALR
jgi:hydroxysqualene dehydroxylase